MGTDDGRQTIAGKNGTSVVDTNTKIYGTDNLFVVDASVIPGMMTANPSGMITAIAEQAAVKMGGLGAPAVIAKVGRIFLRFGSFFFFLSSFFCGKRVGG